MLTLNDGRNELWQWDTGRTISVDAECSQVHFGRNVYGRSIDVDVVDGIAKVPDVLLQVDKPITAWAFVGTHGNGYTKISKEFVVNKRNKPADYVFTQEEQIALRDVIKRLEDVEENQSPEAISKIVNDYLEENPVESPVQSVNDKTGKVHLNAEDVGALPKTTKIPKEYVLPLATSDTLGGIKAEPATEADTQPVRIGENGMLYTAPGGIPGAGNARETSVLAEFTLTEDVDGTIRIPLSANPFEHSALLIEIRSQLMTGGTTQYVGHLYGGGKHSIVFHLNTIFDVSSVRTVYIMTHLFYDSVHSIAAKKVDYMWNTTNHYTDVYPIETDTNAYENVLEITYCSAVSGATVKVQGVK